MPLYSTRELFGGAITATFPAGLIDASDLRQVPDTQEVLLASNSGISYVLEVLEKVTPDDLSDAVKFHFDAVAYDNDAQSSTVHTVQAFSTAMIQGEAPAAIMLSGTQFAEKYNRPDRDEVRILLALYRILSKNVDLVLTCNVPVKATCDDGTVSEDGWAVAKADFETAARSLRIVDYGLFV